MATPEVEVVDARRLPRRVLATLWGWATAVRAALTRPGVERAEGLLLLKAAVATVLAWQLAVHLLDSATPFYAPMAALSSSTASNRSALTRPGSAVGARRRRRSRG